MADSALIFDTHEDIQELVNSGMPEAQAETVVRQRVRLLERNLATKADIAATNANIAATNANIALRPRREATYRVSSLPLRNIQASVECEAIVQASLDDGA